MGDRYPPRRRDYSPAPRRDYSPAPRERYDDYDRGGGGRDRGRDRYDDRGPPRGGGPPPPGKHKITVEGIPDDMTWMELKELGNEYGRSLVFSRTFHMGRTHCGMLEYRDREDADAAIRELNNRRVQGSKDRLRVTNGDLSAEMGRGGGGGGRDYGGGGKGGRDNYRSPPRRRSRSPPRRRGGNDDEPIMTLFVKNLPDDAREQEVQDDIDRAARALRVVMMRRDGGVIGAFVRFDSPRDAERALDEIQSGDLKVCGARVDAEMARRNTEL